MNSTTLDFNIIKRYFKNIPSKDKKNIMNIIKNTKTSEELITSLKQIFYRILVVPNTNEYIEMKIPNHFGLCLQTVFLNKNTYNRDIHNRDNLIHITTIALPNADIECYDYNNIKLIEYNNKVLDLFYDRIKKYFYTVVIDKFRHWNKKIIEKSRRQKRREKRIYHYFIFQLENILKNILQRNLYKLLCIQNITENYGSLKMNKMIKIMI